MTKKEIIDMQDRIGRYLAERRLRDAFADLANTAEAAMLYEITDRVGRLEQTYAYMLRYLTAGADDPQRDALLTDIVAECYEVLDVLVASLMSRETPTLYYNVRRYLERGGAASSTASAIERWRRAVRRATSLSGLYDTAGGGNADAEARKEVEDAEVQLFNCVWASLPLRADDKAAIVDIVTAPSTSASTALRLTSALGLATLEAADRHAIEALCDIYMAVAASDSDSDGAPAKDRAVAAAAFVGLVTALYKYAGRTLYRSTRDRLDAVRDMPTWRSDLRITFMELVRSRDTERINRTMTDKIIPGMMALRPEIEKKMRDVGLSPESLEDIQANPEWEELFSRSGLGDKLKELNELQMEGSDVFMSTFSHLKNFPFFNEVVNWFTPMDHDSIEVDKAISADASLAGVVDLIAQVPFLCDSDKFSMLLSVGMLPDQQRRMMLGQIDAQAGQMDQLRSELMGLTRNDHRRADVRNYLRNLYRFLNLFRRKSEFYNIFDHDANFLSVPDLARDMDDPDLLRLVGEFYFKRSYYEDALAAFGALDRMNQFDSTLYQKMGYAYEKTGDIDNALQYYEQADLLDSTSRWLKMKLAATYRAKDRLPEAIGILLKLADDNPDDVEVELMLGYTYVRAGKYDEALRRFYKVEFLDNGGTRSWRPLAWSLFMTGQYDKAAAYYEKILLDKPTGEDYLNMGHTALARNMFKEAINYYKYYILAAGNDKEAFFKALDVDREHLSAAGIDTNTISLIADAMLYELSN